LFDFRLYLIARIQISAPHVTILKRFDILVAIHKSDCRVWAQIYRMAILVSWDDDNRTIIRWDYDADWTWHESSLAAETTREIREASGHELPVAVILSMAGVEAIPRDSLRNMRRLLQNLQPEDVIIISGSNVAVDVMIAFMRATFTGALGQLHKALSLDDARALAARLLHERYSNHP
jgi:hypothetical protein